MGNPAHGHIARFRNQSLSQHLLEAVIHAAQTLASLNSD
jgi:hypothetical protein